MTTKISSPMVNVVQGTCVHVQGFCVGRESDHENAMTACVYLSVSSPFSIEARAKLVHSLAKRPTGECRCALYMYMYIVYVYLDHVHMYMCKHTYMCTCLVCRLHVGHVIIITVCAFLSVY